MADIAVHMGRLPPPPKAPTHGPTPATEQHQEELKNVTLQLQVLVHFQRSSPLLVWIPGCFWQSMKDSFWLKPPQVHSVLNANWR